MKFIHVGSFAGYSGLYGKIGTSRSMKSAGTGRIPIRLIVWIFSYEVTIYAFLSAFCCCCFFFLLFTELLYMIPTVIRHAQQVFA